MKKVGLFFGSFNPIHTGHLFVADMALERSDIDEVWFVVSPASPYKMHTGELAPNVQRLIMTMKATMYNPRFKVSKIEFDLEKPSYTFKTLEVLMKEFSNHKFSLICGTDVYVDIPKWHLGKELMEVVDFIVYPRNNSTVYTPNELKDKTIWLDGVPTLEISATFIRNQLKNNGSVEHILPKDIKEHIINNKLYI